MHLIRQQSVNRAPTVLFSSTGAAPLRAWDVSVPKDKSGVAESSSEFLSPRESGLQQRVSPVKLIHNTARVDKIFDEDLRCFCVELTGPQVHIATPPSTPLPSTNTPVKGRLPRQSLAITQPWITLLVKNLSDPFHFELTVRDGQGVSRRVRFSTVQSRVKNSQFLICLPIPSDSGDFPSTSSTSKSLDDDPQPTTFAVGWNVVQFNLSQIILDAFGHPLGELSAINVHAACRLKCIICTDKSMTPSQLYDALGQNHWPGSAVDMSRLMLPIANHNNNPSPVSTSTRQAYTRTAMLSPLSHVAAAPSLFVIDNKDRLSSSSVGDTCRRVRSFSAISSSPGSEWSPSTTSGPLRGSSPMSPFQPPHRIVLSRSSLAALDLAEPLPASSLLSSARPPHLLSTPHDSGDEREDSTADSLSLGTSRDFRPSLPPLPECEETAAGVAVACTATRDRGEDDLQTDDDIVPVATHIYSVAGHLFTPVNQLTPVKLNDSPTTSSTSETDSTGASTTKTHRPKRSLTTRLLHKAKLHVHHTTTMSRRNSDLPTPSSSSQIRDEGETTTRRKRTATRGSVFELGVNTE